MMKTRFEDPPAGEDVTSEGAEDAVDDVGSTGSPSYSLEKVSPRAETYLVPKPRTTWRSLGRGSVTLSTSVALGIGIATGVVTIPAAAVVALGLATAQVLGLTWRQNRLGQAVIAGVVARDLDAAEKAAERALVESPSGVMRTLAASNLASVLLQRDRVDVAVKILDSYPPGWFQIPFSTVLWLNNRAFAHLISGAAEGLSAAGSLLDEAEKRMRKSSERGMGGAVNARRLSSALSGTRAMERVRHRDGKTALEKLRMAAELDEGPMTDFRFVERELCRTEALWWDQQKDQAVVVAQSLVSTPMTPRQAQAYGALRVLVKIN